MVPLISFIYFINWILDIYFPNVKLVQELVSTGGLNVILRIT